MAAPLALAYDRARRDAERDREMENGVISGRGMDVTGAKERVCKID